MFVVKLKFNFPTLRAGIAFGGCCCCCCCMAPPGVMGSEREGMVGGVFSANGGMAIGETMGEIVFGEIFAVVDVVMVDVAVVGVTIAVAAELAALAAVGEVT